MLPLSKPGLASVIIYQALFAWNEYIFALTFLSANDVKTLPLTLTVFVGRYASDWPKIFAILSLSVIPIIILYLFLQKYFIRGLTAGAVKGWGGECDDKNKKEISSNAPLGTLLLFAPFHFSDLRFSVLSNAGLSQAFFYELG